MVHSGGMRRIVLILGLLAGCHRGAPPPEHATGDMSKGRKFACAMSNGNVYRDAYGQERCWASGPTVLDRQPETTCVRTGDTVRCSQ